MIRRIIPTIQQFRLPHFKGNLLHQLRITVKQLLSGNVDEISNSGRERFRATSITSFRGSFPLLHCSKRRNYNF